MANVAVLLLVLVALAPRAAGQTPVVITGRADPTVSTGASAATVHGPGGPSVIVTSTGAPPVVIPEAREPSLSTSAIALTTARGVEVRLWRTGQVVLTVPGATRPALAGRYLGYVRATPTGSRLFVRDLRTGRTTLVTRVGPAVDLGRPSISGRLVVWHEASGLRSRLLMRPIGGRVVVLSQTLRRWQVTYPSIARGRVVWVESDAERSWLRTRRLGERRSRVIATSARGQMFTTTATDGVRAWVTSWRFATTTARIVAVRLP